MHQHRYRKRFRKGFRKIALVGNPNVGKSIVFSHLTGKYMTASNYPGTTVELARGIGRIGGMEFEVIDTPGINSLVPLGEDERVARDVLLEDVDVVVQVADAKNLKRTLMITLQLAELKIPLVLNLNMMDEAERKGIEIDTEKLSEILGIDVVETVATEGIGVRELREAILKAKVPKFEIEYTKNIKKAILEVEKIVGNRGIATMILSDTHLKGFLKEMYKIKFEQIELKKIQERFSKPLYILLSVERQKTVSKIVESLCITRNKKTFFEEKVSSFTMNPLTGIPLFFIILFLTYEFVGVLGAQYLVDFFEVRIFGEIINPFTTKFVLTYIPFKLIQELLVGQFGVVTMALTYSIAIIFPIITTFFLIFGILEDSGYFPRLASMANSAFKRIGLNGKAVLPMILGLGCDTMATVTTRILETRKERTIATLLLALGVPCSAQLGVILAMLAYISSKALIIVFGIVLLQLFLVGYLSSKLLKGEISDFVLEIPPIRVPKLKNILMKTYIRLKWYLLEVVPIFIIGTLILFIFDKSQLLKFLQNFLKPVVYMMDLPSETVNAFVMGFLRRDYGAAGLYVLQRDGILSNNQIVVSLVVITLFVPCIANFLVMIKERGLKTAIAIVLFIIPYAILVGIALNFVLEIFGVIL
ncbi:MAG: ferrous iron transport protein B [Candidatus Methanofastidiosia archaeon]